ncbi:major facilitator superfamily domain-containing protein, partial [Kockovaella imperatae]
AYAPQLASKLDLSSTEINLIGVAGNFGMYLTGPLWGKFVDSRGQQMQLTGQRPLLCSSIVIFTGYFLVHSFYSGALPIRPDSSHHPTTIGLLGLAFAMFLSGSGGAGGLSAAVNAAAKSFSDQTRATASGLVLAGFGLSAFAFSTLGHVIFGGDAGGLLLLLSFGTGIPIFLGSFIVRAVPPATANGYEPVSALEEGEGYVSRNTSVELSRSRSPRPRHRHAEPEDGKAPLRAGHSYTPFELLFTSDFWIIGVILALLCGTGLMYINNVGSVALALTREGKVDYDPRVVSAWQAKQVATVSIWNCMGRIIGGIYSDFCKTRFGMERIWFLPVVAGLFIISQLSALNTTVVSNLWIVSTLLGLAYGSLFNVVPMLVLEWFGMGHFSQNYGWICVAPVIGGNVFNVVFGRVYDSNTVGRIGLPTGVSGTISELRRLVVKAAGEVGRHDCMCLVGEQCYGTAFKISALGCTVALGLSIWAGVRRRRRL